MTLQGHSKTSEAMQYSVEFTSRTKDNRATWIETLSQSGTWYTCRPTNLL